MTERVEDERFPEPDESQIQPGETRQEWSARNAAAAVAAAKKAEADAEAHKGAEGDKALAEAEAAEAEAEATLATVSNEPGGAEAVAEAKAEEGI